jgi:hypothetical protein
MLKAIYLNVALLLRGSHRSDYAADVSQVQQMMGTALQGGTPSANLTGQVKRLTWSVSPNHQSAEVKTIVYMEGEQDAPQNFIVLAVSETQALLAEALRQPIADKIDVQVVLVEENRDAYDELADANLL